MCQFFEFYFPYALSLLESERIGGEPLVRFPILDAKRVLGSAGHGFAGDDILARDRTGSGFDPNLRVRVLVAKRQMLVLDAVNDAVGIRDPLRVGRRRGYARRPPAPCRSSAPRR